MSKRRQIVIDEQTGRSFVVIPESWYDVLAAWISAAYSLAAIAYLGWLLLDTWSGRFSTWFLIPVKEVLGRQVDANVFRLVVYTAIGGGMGAAISNIRGFLQWHAERRGFGWRFVWQYIALPPLGATLAVLVYGLIQSGMAVFNGGSVSVSSITSFSAWATGTLAGYGSHHVFAWLDDKVKSLFNVDVKKVEVPDVAGKSITEATQILASAKLIVGAVSEESTSEKEKIGKVIEQEPAAKTEIACGSEVAIAIGIQREEKAAGAALPDALHTREDANKQIVPNGKPPVIGDGTQALETTQVGLGDETLVKKK